MVLITGAIVKVTSLRSVTATGTMSASATAADVRETHFKLIAAQFEALACLFPFSALPRTNRLPAAS